MKRWSVVLTVLSAVLLSTTVLAFTGLPYLPLELTSRQNSYAPPSISAEAVGNPTPDQLVDASPEDAVLNGDFVIRLTGGEADTTLGNGIDEQTTWNFDFSEDPDFPVFLNADSLALAHLTLTLTPKSPGITNDFVKIEGLPGIRPALFLQNPPLDTDSTVELELLDFYTSEEILEILNQGSQGQIPMVFRDDAIVSFASLDLTPE